MLDTVTAYAIPHAEPAHGIAAIDGEATAFLDTQETNSAAQSHHAITLASYASDTPVVIRRRPVAIVPAQPATQASAPGVSPDPAVAAAEKAIIGNLLNIMPIEAKVIVEHPLLDPDTAGERPSLTELYYALG